MKRREARWTHERDGLECRNGAPICTVLPEHEADTQYRRLTPPCLSTSHSYEAGGYHPVVVGEVSRGVTGGAYLSGTLRAGISHDIAHPILPAKQTFSNGRYIVVRKLGWGHFSTVSSCFISLSLPCPPAFPVVSLASNGRARSLGALLLPLISPSIPGSEYPKSGLGRERGRERGGNE